MRAHPTQREALTLSSFGTCPSWMSALLTVPEVSRYGDLCRLPRDVAAPVPQAEFTDILGSMLHARGIFSCPDGTVGLADGHSPWMLGTFHCSVRVAGGKKAHLSPWVYPEGTDARKIRKDMDEASSPGVLPCLLRGPRREDITVWKKILSFIKRNH